MMNIATMKSVVAILFFLFMLSACGGKEDGSIATAPEVASIPLAYHSHSFYKDFAHLDTNNLAAGLRQLAGKYPGFSNFYLDTIAGFNISGHYDADNHMLRDFLTLKDFRHLLDTVDMAFPDTKKYDDWLRQSFKLVKYYRVPLELPENVYYFVSYLNGMTAVIQNKTNIGVGLDMFLGRDFMPYKQVSIPDYATIRFTDSNIPIWVNMALYQDAYPFEPENKTLQTLMIEKGKELYFLEKVCPFLPPELKFGFTPEQYKWCGQNEALIYNFFLQQNLLFEKNMQKIMRFVIDGATSAGMPAESPGNVGSYIGYKIVKAYADNNGADLKTLLQEKDMDKIMRGANYKP
ncbi:MAG: hypothetical protein QM642_00785 [Edaphocola sp.]